MKTGHDQDNDSKRETPIKESVYELARRIPEGSVLSYGEIGALCNPPISGYICGRILGTVPDDVPWWRIVAKDGTLPVAKRSPQIAREQREMLEEEGVRFDKEGKVRMDEFRAKMQGRNDLQLGFGEEYGN